MTVVLHRKFRGLEPVSIAVAVSRGRRPDPKVVPQARRENPREVSRGSRG